MYKIILHFVRFRKAQTGDFIAQYGQLRHARVVDCAPCYRYSSLYHLDGFPPVCLLHEVEASTGVDDELVPFSQGVQLADELARRDHPHEFYSYEGLSHYFSTEADNATTQQMWQDSLDCLQTFLKDR